jgi:hypothetical protein
MVFSDLNLLRVVLKLFSWLVVIQFVAFDDTKMRRGKYL